MITLQDMKDIKAAVQGRAVRPDGTVDHASPALTPHLTLGIVWYDFELVGYDWLRRDGLLDVIDVVSPWVWLQSANRTADYSTRVIEKLRTYVPNHAIYAGVYVQNSAGGNPGGGVWVDPGSVRHILTQTPQLYDRGEIAGSLIFAGIWLEAATMSAKLEESFALPQLLNRSYSPYVGTAAVTIVDAANRPVARRFNRSIKCRAMRAWRALQVRSARVRLREGGRRAEQAGLRMGDELDRHGGHHPLEAALGADEQAQEGRGPVAAQRRRHGVLGKERGPQGHLRGVRRARACARRRGRGRGRRRVGDGAITPRSRGGGPK